MRSALIVFAALIGQAHAQQPAPDSSALAAALFLGNTDGGRIALTWDRVGEPPQIDLIEALRQRGAHLEELACLQWGASEFSRVYAVAPGDREAFGLRIDSREAPTAHSNSSYGATMYAGGPPSLAELQADQPGWAKRCE